MNKVTELSVNSIVLGVDKVNGKSPDITEGKGEIEIVYTSPIPLVLTDRTFNLH